MLFLFLRSDLEILLIIINSYRFIIRKHVFKKMSLYSNLSTSLKRKLVYAHISILIMLCIGTVSFHFIENLSWMDSLYFTAATVTTVGYGDIVPRTETGRFFTTFFILFGVGTVLYALSILAQSQRIPLLKCLYEPLRRLV